ncbi:MAG: hypothetical protein ABIH72_04260 [archaeon]
MVNLFIQLSKKYIERMHYQSGPEECNRVLSEIKQAMTDKGYDGPSICDKYRHPQMNVAALVSAVDECEEIFSEKDKDI